MYLYLNIDNIIIDIVDDVKPIYRNKNNIIVLCYLDKAQGFLGSNNEIYAKMGINFIPSYTDVKEFVFVENIPDYVIPRMYKYENGQFTKAEHYELSNAQLTPYTDTKTAYYGETEKTFYDVPAGNVTVFIGGYSGSYSVERIENRLTVRFDAITKQADVTISVQ